jgi:hypothetical protein
MASDDYYKGSQQVLSKGIGIDVLERARMANRDPLVLVMVCDFQRIGFLDFFLFFVPAEYFGGVFFSPHDRLVCQLAASHISLARLKCF